eukprot:403362740
MKTQEKKGRGIYALTEISISDSDYTDEDPDNHNLLRNLQDESVSMATDYDRFRTVRDSFDNYQHKLELLDDKEEVYKYFNRLMFKIKKKKTEFEKLSNKLVDLKRLGKEKNMSTQLNQAADNHSKMKLKSRKQRFDVENYQMVLARQKIETGLMKEKCEEYNQIFRQYNDTKQKYEIVNDVTQKELMDITNRLEQAKKILAKRLLDNQKKLEDRQIQFSRIEKSIVEQDELKKIYHKEALKSERDAFIRKEQEIVHKKQEEILNHIHEFVHDDMTRIEERYELIFEKLGTSNVKDLKQKIIDQVIPFDIHKQSLENEMRDKFQAIGVLKGQKQQLLEELSKSKEQYEIEYKQQEKFQLIKIKEKEQHLIQFKKHQEFYMEKIEINSKLANQVRNFIVNLVLETFNISNLFGFLGAQIEKCIYSVSCKMATFQNFQSPPGGNRMGRRDTLRSKISGQRLIMRSLGSNLKKIIFNQPSKALGQNDSQVQESILIKFDMTGALLTLKKNSLFLDHLNHPDINELKQMRRNAENLLIGNHNEEDSDYDEEMKAHKKRQKLENKEKEKEKGLTKARNNGLTKKFTNRGPFLLDKLLVSKKQSQTVIDHEDISDSERELIQIRNEQLIPDLLTMFISRLKLVNKKQTEQPNVIIPKQQKKDQKPKTIEEELFSKDEFIQGNKDIKRKWYIQNLNNLRKCEKRFRGVYLQLEFQDLDKFREGETYFNDELWVGKSPDEIKKKLKNLNLASQGQNNFSRTLSLNSDLNFNPSFRENSTLGALKPKQYQESNQNSVISNIIDDNKPSKMNKNKQLLEKDNDEYYNLESYKYLFQSAGSELNSEPTLFYSVTENDQDQDHLKSRSKLQSQQSNSRQFFQSNLSAYKFPQIQDFQKTLPHGYLNQKQTNQQTANQQKPMTSQMQKSASVRQNYSLGRAQSQGLISPTNNNQELNNQQRSELSPQENQEFMYSTQQTQSQQSQMKNLYNNIKNDKEIEKLLLKLKAGTITQAASNSTYNSTMFKFQNVYNLKKPMRRNIDKFIQKGVVEPRVNQNILSDL